jgi:HAD superfamily hydrolase (TIGR01490 family)
MYLRAPYWLIRDRIDREMFLRGFHAHYDGFPVEAVRGLSSRCFEEVILPRLIPQVVEKVKKHRSHGDRILLVSGALDFILKPLATFLDAEVILSPSLIEENGFFVGKTSRESFIGKGKVQIVLQYAERQGLDLSRSYAYGDDLSDLPLFMTVGKPVVVNPGFRLQRIARRQGWEIMLRCFS